MKDFLTTEQVGALLGVNDSRVRQLIAAGRLPATKHGHVWLVRLTDVDAVRERKTGRPALAVSRSTDPIPFTYGDLRTAMLEAKTEEDKRYLYEQLRKFHREARRHEAQSNYLGAPQNAEEATLQALSSALDPSSPQALPPTARAAWLEVLDVITRERGT